MFLLSVFAFICIKYYNSQSKKPQHHIVVTYSSSIEENNSYYSDIVSPIINDTTTSYEEVTEEIYDTDESTKETSSNKKDTSSKGKKPSKASSVSSKKTKTSSTSSKSQNKSSKQEPPPSNYSSVTIEYEEPPKVEEITSSEFNFSIIDFTSSQVSSNSNEGNSSGESSNPEYKPVSSVEEISYQEILDRIKSNFSIPISVSKNISGNIAVNVLNQLESFLMVTPIEVLSEIGINEIVLSDDTVNSSYNGNILYIKSNYDCAKMVKMLCDRIKNDILTVSVSLSEYNPQDFIYNSDNSYMKEFLYSNGNTDFCIFYNELCMVDEDYEYNLTACAYLNRELTNVNTASPLYKKIIKIENAIAQKHPAFIEWIKSMQ
ncbi:MAG: hypothetical protein RSE93_04210 [Oscillospiraceae bacterium]